MTKKYNSDYDQIETESSNMMKTVILGLVGSIATYYATMWAKRLLEEKPLKTRVREGREKVVQISNNAMSKASSVKSTAKSKVNHAAEKAKALIEEKGSKLEDSAHRAENKVDRMIEESPTLSNDNRGIE